MAHLPDGSGSDAYRLRPSQLYSVGDSLEREGLPLNQQESIMEGTIPGSLFTTFASMARKATASLSIR